MRKYALFIAIAFISGCATAPPRQPRFADPAMLEEVFAANPFHNPLRGRGKITIRKEGDRTFPASLLADRPYYFRLSVSGPLGGVWMLAVADPDKFHLLVPSRSVRTELSRRKGGMVEIGGQKIHPDDIIRFIAGGLEREWVLGGKPLVSRKGLVITHGETEYRLFPGKDRVLKKVEVLRPGAGLLEIRFDYRDEGITAVRFGNAFTFNWLRLSWVESVPPSFFRPPDF